MGILDKIMGRAPVPDEVINEPLPQTLVAELARPFVNLHALNAAGMRRGQWVMSTAGIGILTGSRIDGQAEVTLIKPDGTTRMELDIDDKAVPAVRVLDMGQLRTAHIEEIPDTRHEGEDHLRGFGYISASEA